MTRMSPIPEDMDLSNPELARRVWDPYHRDAFVERQAKIRGCLDLATVLITVPDFYRGALHFLGPAFNSDSNNWNTATPPNPTNKPLKLNAPSPSPSTPRSSL